jgi:hypothetical protein
MLAKKYLRFPPIPGPLFRADFDYSGGGMMCSLAKEHRLRWLVVGDVQLWPAFKS